MRSLDKLFGGKPGAAERARISMERSYGPAKGRKVFEATVIKRKHKAVRQAVGGARKKSR